MAQEASPLVLALLAAIVVVLIWQLAPPRRSGPRQAKFVPPPQPADFTPPNRDGLGPGSQGSGRDWHLDPDSHEITPDGRLVHVGEGPMMAAFDRMFGRGSSEEFGGAGGGERFADGPDAGFAHPRWDHSNELFPFHGFSESCADDRYAAPNAARTLGPHAYVTPSEGSPSRAFYDEVRERCSAQSALARLYSSADVDPLITGQLYATADNMRDVYAQRTSHGDVHGLTEFSSSGGPGDVGVDVGPLGLAEYGGAVVGYDDGIPENWTFPSTPVRWYAPQQRDHYGPEGPTVYGEGLYSLTEPDHDPLMN